MKDFISSTAKQKVGTTIRTTTNLINKAKGHAQATITNAKA